MRAAHAMLSRALVVAVCIAAASPSLAATTQLPAETKGDPKPDTGSHEKGKTNPDQQGQGANIKQNTTHQGYQQDR